MGDSVHADLIFRGGDIVTVDPARPEARALAVKDGRILAVGDALRTDIVGAKAVEVDAVLVAGGLHGEAFAATGGGLDGSRIAQACRQAGLAPIAALPGFVW